MRIPFVPVACSCLLLFFACNEPKEKVETVPSPGLAADTIKRAFIPVTEFIRGQLKEISELQLTPLHVIARGDKKDSTWIKNTDIRNYAQPFLEPEIDSLHMGAFFNESSFLDQTLNAVTFTYSPKIALPDSIKLNRWDVFINPETNEIQRVYMVKSLKQMDKHVTQQLTWKSGYYLKIIQITESPGKASTIKEEQVIWNFN